MHHRIDLLQLRTEWRDWNGSMIEFRKLHREIGQLNYHQTEIIFDSKYKKENV